jgi:hypothetical protein
MFPQLIFAVCPRFVVGKSPFAAHTIALHPLVTIDPQDPALEHARDCVPVWPVPHAMAGAVEPAFVAAKPPFAAHTMALQPVVPIDPQEPVLEHARDFCPVCPVPQLILAVDPALVVGNPPWAAQCDLRLQSEDQCWLHGMHLFWGAGRDIQTNGNGDCITTKN